MRFAPAQERRHGLALLRRGSKMSVARHSLGAIHLVTEMQIGSAQPGSTRPNVPVENPNSEL